MLSCRTRRLGRPGLLHRIGPGGLPRGSLRPSRPLPFICTSRGGHGRVNGSMGSDRTVDFRVRYVENVLSKTPVLTLKRGLQAQCCVREAVGSEMEADTCPGEDRPRGNPAGDAAPGICCHRHSARCCCSELDTRGTPWSFGVPRVT